LVEVLRVRMMHWHKATFFADLIPRHCGSFFPCAPIVSSLSHNIETDDDDDHEEVQQTAGSDRQMAYWASAALVAPLSFFLCLHVVSLLPQWMTTRFIWRLRRWGLLCWSQSQQCALPHSPFYIIVLNSLFGTR
jgi:hypothetical protein